MFARDEGCRKVSAVAAEMPQKRRMPPLAETLVVFFPADNHKSRPVTASTSPLAEVAEHKPENQDEVWRQAAWGRFRCWRGFPHFDNKFEGLEQTDIPQPDRGVRIALIGNNEAVAAKILKNAVKLFAYPRVYPPL
jgi:hypothetical protein